MNHLKKFALLLAVAGILGGTYWYLATPPKFAGPNAGQKTMAWEFDHATTDSEKARLSLFESPLFDYSRAIELAQNGQTDLTQSDIKTLKQMEKFRNKIVDKIKKLHASLSTEDIRAITHDNPYSLYTLFDTFVMSPSARPDCSNEDVTKLAETLGSDVFLKTGMELIVYPWMRESQFTEGYMSRLRDLVKNDHRFSEYKDLEETYFKFSSYESKDLKLFTQGMGTDPQVSLNRTKQKILEDGRSEATLDRDLFQLASVAPGCFINPFAFSKAETVWRTNQVGQKLLLKIQDYVARTKTVPTGLDAILDQTDDLSIKRDGWYREFRLETENGYLSVVSNGEDRKKSEDDIVIGRIRIP